MLMNTEEIIKKSIEKNIKAARKADAAEVKRKSKAIYRAITTIDENVGKPLLFYMDRD